MDEERIKQAVLAAIERTDFAGAVASAVTAQVVATGATERAAIAEPAAPSHSAEAQKVLTRIVLGDILDDSILGARPQDRTFPLRVFFSELGALIGRDGHDGELAFTLASGLSFFFRAPMEAEAKIRVGLEVSRQLYALAYDDDVSRHVKMESEVVAKTAPLLATLMSTELERVRFESVDHAKVYDSQIHERTAASDPTGSRILRPASFLCRVQANNAVKAKAQVVT